MGLGICWLMFASTTLNYMDRQSISLVGSMIQKEFELSFADFGWVLGLVSVVLRPLPGAGGVFGRSLERALGVRRRGGLLVAGGDGGGGACRAWPC